MPRKTIQQINVSGKRVLMRVDFNVPLDKEGHITDERRIRQALPGIKSVVERGGRLVLMSHLGRPIGGGYESALSLRPAADRLGKLLEGVKVVFAADDCVGEAAGTAAKSLQDGEVLVLENLRFHEGEKKGDPAFAGKLAAYGDIYCNDAFGTAHRSHASMVAVPRAMQDRPRVAGLLLEKELNYHGEMIENPARPFIALLGGVKVSDKIGVLHNLMGKVDSILIGGAMSYTLLRAKGCATGSSQVETDKIDEARGIIEQASQSSTELLLPLDHVCGKEISPDTEILETPGVDIPEHWLGLDIGPRTRETFGERVLSAKTIIWNGPMGVFEIPPFDAGTRELARAIGEATSGGAISVVGGGDSAAAVEAFGLGASFTHISTGGGASLQMMEGRSFESVELLEQA